MVNHLNRNPSSLHWFWEAQVPFESPLIDLINVFTCFHSNWFISIFLVSSFFWLFNINRYVERSLMAFLAPRTKTNHCLALLWCLATYLFQLLNCFSREMLFLSLFFLLLCWFTNQRSLFNHWTNERLARDWLLTPNVPCFISLYSKTCGVSPTKMKKKPKTVSHRCVRRDVLCFHKSSDAHVLM